MIAADGEMERGLHISTCCRFSLFPEVGGIFTIVLAGEPATACGSECGCAGSILILDSNPRTAAGGASRYLELRCPLPRTSSTTQTPDMKNRRRLENRSAGVYVKLQSCL